MTLLRYFSFSLFQLFSLLLVVVFLLGALNLNFSDRKDYCAMTYMFEYPQFVRISVASNNLYPQYGLYSYSEGRLTEKARKMWFDGVPVLFLPGNSGSHMQVRSLASVALRKGLSSRKYHFHFDYFTVSYSEDLSGLYGGVLERETEFAAACIQEILNLYKVNKYTKTVPTTVILIGHSMGGIIAMRLLAYPSTLNMTSLAVTLAAPLEAPVINFDVDMNEYYSATYNEWGYLNDEMRSKKVLISFGNGPRDALMPSSLTSSEYSDLRALTTAIPGVWVSPNHVSIVWCKQLVLALNKYLFSVISKDTQQLSTQKQHMVDRARRYFQANRSIYLNPNITRPTSTDFVPNAFWYEDNRRLFQISRPEVEVATHLMIRLFDFHQHRFVAVEVVGSNDSDWLFGCNAMFTEDNHRYCKQGTSMTELSRWTGAAADYGKRKLATIHLHDIRLRHPEWSHVIIRLAPSSKPVTINVDINDLASRQITVNIPFSLPFAQQTVIEQTIANSLYYELQLPDLTVVHQAYLLYIEPRRSCRANKYHVTAELFVPWAEGHESFHYFTPSKRTPMKLRLFKSKPDNVSTESAKVTLMLDPKCTFTVRIEPSWYYSVAQMARFYTPALISYIAALFLLATRTNILNLVRGATCVSLNSALFSEGVKPYYALFFSRILLIFVTSIPSLHDAMFNASWSNLEMKRFNSSILVLLFYMIALGIANIIAAGVLVALISSSQLAHRLLFRIMFRSGGGALADKITWVLHRAPLAISALCFTAVHCACGAAALVGGAAFYATILSKMYEEYLEDIVYKIMAKVAARLFRFRKTQNASDKSDNSEPASRINESSEDADSENVNTQDTKNILPSDDLEKKTSSDIDIETSCNDTEKSISEPNASNIECDNTQSDNKPRDDTKVLTNETNDDSKGDNKLNDETKALKTFTNETNDDSNCCEKKKAKGKSVEEMEEELHNINFHMNMFILWLVVTALNIPALLTWAKNFKYSKSLTPDTSYVPGLVLSLCSGYIWNLNGPKANLPLYEAIGGIIFSTVVVILFFGPQSLYFVNYGVTLVFLLITLQQVFDKEVDDTIISAKQSSQNNNLEKVEQNTSEDLNCDSINEEQADLNTKDEGAPKNEDNEGEQSQTSQSSNDVSKDENPEASIYKVFKNLRERFSHSNDL